MAWGQSLYMCTDSCQFFLPSCYVSFQKKYFCTLHIFSPFTIEFCCIVYLNLWCTWLPSKLTDREMSWPHMYCLWLWLKAWVQLLCKYKSILTSTSTCKYAKAWVWVHAHYKAVSKSWWLMFIAVIWSIDTINVRSFVLC